MRFVVASALIGGGIIIGWSARSLHFSAQTAPPQATVDVARTESTPKALSAPVVAEVSPLLGYLEQGRYAQAADWLAAEHSSGRSASLDGYTPILAEYVAKLKVGGRGAETTALLERIVAALPDYFDARMMLAQAFQSMKNYDAAIDTLYDGRPYVATVNQLQRINEQIERGVTAYHGSLLECCDAKSRIALYERLIALDPGQTRYYIALAEAYGDSGQQLAATSTLNVVVHDSEVGAQARVLLASLEDRTPEGTRIALVKRGNQYFVNTLLNDRVEAELLLDTGASISVLSASTFSRLAPFAAEPLGRRQLTTANGVVDAQIFRIQSLAISGKRLEDIVIAVVEQLDDSGIPGLLGMDYLDKFRFSVDQKADALYLR